MQATDSYVDISKLYKAYGQGDVRVDVLNGIDVAVERGEMCVLLGPSGSGKSTFLNLLGGLEAADHGSIRVNGTDICQLAGRDLVDYRRRELGFVFQFYNLLPDLTIRENVEVCAHLAQDPLDVDDLFDRLGILAQAKKLCDEPTGALDYETSLDVLGVLEQVNDEFGCTMVIVTHNDAIARMSHRVLRLREGQIVKNEVNESRVHARDLVW